MSDDGNVIDLGTKMTLEPVRSRHTGCRHTSVMVIEDSRLLECSGCGKVIDPFDYLFSHAKGQQCVVWDLKQIKWELSDLKKTLESLKKEKRNLQAQVNRLKKNPELIK